MECVGPGLAFPENQRICILQTILQITMPIFRMILAPVRVETYKGIPPPLLVELRVEQMSFLNQVMLRRGGGSVSKVFVGSAWWGPCWPLG